MMKKTYLIVIGLFLLTIFSLNTFTQDNFWKNWVKFNDNPIVYSENTWFDFAFNPIIIHEEGKYRMWFTGYKLEHWARQIGYAESFDGLTWDFHEEPVIECGLPGSLQRNRLIGNVLRVNDTLRIWYGGYNHNFKKYSTYYGWSLDGLEWNLRIYPVLCKGSPGQWDEEGVFGWPVYYDGATYHMYYGTNNDFGYAKSTDGIHWEKDYENNPVFIRGPQGSWYDEWVIPGPVIVQDDYIYMFFSGSDGSQGSGCAGYFRSGYAWSKDFINWTVGNNNEYILDKGGSGDWDKLAAWVTCVLYHDNQYKMWYTGINQEWAMGSAGLVTDINELSRPERVSLNISPSPFTNEVTLNYQLFDNSHVKLAIYSLNGQCVTLLVNETKKQGKYDIVFNGSDLPGGIYFCVIETEDGTTAKKVIKLN